MRTEHSITFIDEISNRRISYDAPKEMEFLDTGGVRIKCKDGFKTIICSDEWQRIMKKKVGINDKV